MNKENNIYICIIHIIVYYECIFNWFNNIYAELCYVNVVGAGVTVIKGDEAKYTCTCIILYMNVRVYDF